MLECLFFGLFMEKILENIIEKSIGRVSDKETLLTIIKKELEGKNVSSFPSNIILLGKYRAMVTKGSISPDKKLEEILITKRMRSLSGVAVITVLTKPWPCPGECLYCPSESKVPKSYLSTEPAVRRAILCDYDPSKQVKARLESLRLEGHPTDKIELIIIGGTFSYLPRDYQEEFVKCCFDTLNGKKSKSLAEAKKTNESGENRCVGLTLETRPDYITGEEAEWFRYLGATRVELGVQSVFDEVLKLNKRGHDVLATVRATKILKNAGFKICYHMMPNLPGSTYEKDIENFKIIFSDERFQPDYIKIYPCLVVKGSELYQLWKEGKYTPYTEIELERLICEVKQVVPYYIRIMRLIRDIPSGNIEAGSKVTNLRQLVQGKVKCRCIRCRETGLNMENGKCKMRKLKLFREEYPANNGREIFLSYENEERTLLYSLLRLRLPKDWSIKAIEGCALIREVHTYGQQMKIGSKGIIQHTGFGKKLLAEAENIAKEEGYEKVAVISGVGVRNYYRRLNYYLSSEYMLKKIT